jgi:F0F1-type ATP synthase membrane subunit b/b'
MSEQSPLSADLGHEGQFALERRGYSRMQVDEAVAQLRLETRGLLDSRRDLEDRLSQALDESERLKLELSAARSSGKPAHQELSERISQILKLADDEANSQRNKAEEEIGKLRADAQGETTKLRADAEAETTKLRADVKAETDRSRAAAQEQAERMLSAAQEQAETTVATAKAEAESTRKSATAEAQQVVSEATKQAETALATAKSQAKQQLDEATARATAIHDGAERRLNLLMSRHTETLRRLTEIRDVVTSLVAGEADRGSLEDEVARIVAGSVGGESRPGNGRPGAPADGGKHAGGNGHPDGKPALSTAQRPGLPGSAAAAPGTTRSGPAHGAAPGAAPGNGQHQGRPLPDPIGLQGPVASGPAAPGGPSPVVPAGPAPVPGRAASPARPAQTRPSGSEATPSGPQSPDAPAPREVDDTAADLKAITE